MAIEKYVTECFILNSYESGEHDMTYKLFTEEFGLIFARATSIRKLESKLRAHMKPGYLSRVTVVKGKEVWRVTGSEEILSADNLRHEVTKLLERFVRGEGPHKVLFKHMKDIIFAKEMDERTGRLLINYLLLVDLGYADAQVVGAKNIEEYLSWKIEDLYTQSILKKELMRSHVMQVLGQMQL
jgi:recombinational DNA repair protein (RecF pathway)